MGDGNINYVYIVEGPAGALVVKQGLPYIRIAHDWPLTQARQPLSKLAMPKQEPYAILCPALHDATHTVHDAEEAIQHIDKGIYNDRLAGFIL